MHPLVYLPVLVALLVLPQPRSVGGGDAIRDFGLASEGVGWLQTESRLIWTDNEGRDWRELGAVEGELITADFVSPQLGWAIAIAPGMTGSGVLTHGENAGRRRDLATG